MSPLNNSRYPFLNLSLTPTNTATSEMLSFKVNGNISKNYNISEFMQPEENILLNRIDKGQSCKRKIKFVMR